MSIIASLLFAQQACAHTPHTLHSHHMFLSTTATLSGIQQQQKQPTRVKLRCNKNNKQRENTFSIFPKVHSTCLVILKKKRLPPQFSPVPQLRISTQPITLLFIVTTEQMNKQKKQNKKNKFHGQKQPNQHFISILYSVMTPSRIIPNDLPPILSCFLSLSFSFFIHLTQYIVHDKMQQHTHKYIMNGGCVDTMYLK